MRMILDDITNLVVRKANHRLYYFDSKGIYHSVPEEVGLSMNFSNIIYRYDGSFYIDTSFLSNLVPNNGISVSAISKLKEGDTLEDLDYLLCNTKYKYHTKPIGLDRFITRIEPPIFIRTPENENINTFDFIYVDLNLIVDWNEDKLQYIKKNIKAIDEMVLDRLESNISFKKYGIPINFLKLGRRSLKNNGRLLEYVFELKSID